MKLLLNTFVAMLLLISAQTCNNTSETKDTKPTEVNTSEKMEITGTIEQQKKTLFCRYCLRQVNLLAWHIIMLGKLPNYVKSIFRLT